MASKSVRAMDLYNLAIALIAAGLQEKAQEALKKNLVLSPLNTDALFALGLIHAESHKWRSAAACFEKVIALTPSSAGAFRLLGVTESRMALFEKAFERLSTALAHHGEDVETLNNMALALVRKGELVQAMGRLNEALRLAPTNENVRHNLAQVTARIRKGT